jgi:NADPH:quinone reductase-like Zn-dependent oxidoreductase
MRAVQFDRYGDEAVLEVREVPDPPTAPGRLVVAVKAASINPGEMSIREGALHEVWPATFPSGQGSDFAGTVAEVGEGVEGYAVGDAVLGYNDERGSQAELVSAPAEQVVAKPDGLAWEVAGSMFVAPAAGWACVTTVAPQPGETVVVSSGAGGVGSVAVQLARRTGATVIGLASPTNHDWLREHDIVPLTYGDGLKDRLEAAAPNGLDAMLDTFGGGYVDLAVELGISPERINTITDREAAARVGASTVGSSQIISPEVLAELTRVAASGELEIPIAATFPLDEVRAAYRQLAARHTHGKIVLLI